MNNVDMKLLISNVLADMTYACSFFIGNINTSIMHSQLTGNSIEDKWFDCLQQGGVLYIDLLGEYADDFDNDILELTYDDLCTAIKKILKEFPLYEKWDSDQTNLVVQYALFGQYVYD